MSARPPAPRRQQIAPTPLAYRIPKAAALIGISPSTLWAKIAKGEIEACKIGGATVIRHAELQSYVDALQPVTKAAH